MSYEPTIIAFLCNWCSYTAADLAGTARMKYPANIRTIKTMCSGRVAPTFMISALQQGADGVIVGACHIGDCHYQTGNYSTRRRVAAVKVFLTSLGIDPRRLRLEWISASEGAQFAQVMTEFVEELKSLGPNPINEGVAHAQ
jgi:F420-non-reducing hydrogenase iron-sulfur subunit